ncbi:MAG: protocatechuate 3,4-dioxygenase subunit alpha [SAR324 cluster bacterium]|nr:protocatechuate 3,4-dioxygenase subunit alpha [SAR324 cluster bacterium]
MSKETPSQTVGPYFDYGLTPERYGKTGIANNILTKKETQGIRIRLEGQVFDGEGSPISDALIEIWQSNSQGRYRHPNDDREEFALDEHFHGFGRAPTNNNGEYWFETIKPGPVPSRGNVLQAPHINLIVMMRGMLVHAYSRLYFSDELEANSNDPVLSSIEEERRGTLIAVRQERAGQLIYRLDIHMQGEQETVFFDA